MKKTLETAILAVAICSAGMFAWAEGAGCGTKACAKGEALKPACASPASPAATMDGKVATEGTKACCAKGQCGAKKGVCAAKAEEGANLSTDELKALIAEGQVAAILDARSGKWDDGNRIPGAKTLSPGAAEDVVAATVPDKAALIVTYCSNLKCPASAKLAAHLRTLGYTNVKEYPHGIAGWIEAGNTVEKAVL